MLLTQMMIVGPSIPDDLLTVRTGVTVGVHVLGLDVITDIGGFRLVATSKTLPLASTKIGH